MGIESIGKFEVKNSDVPPAVLGEKFCKLDINVTVDGRVVDLEVQVDDEGDYPERSLYYWAREYSNALAAGCGYHELPETIVVSIVAFEMFKDCADFHSEFRPLEVTRHTALTPKMSLHYFELPKLPKTAIEDAAANELMQWLLLFNAKTEEDLLTIQETGDPIMAEVIEAYRSVTASDEFKELERLRDRAGHNEASALHADRMERAKRLKARGIDTDIIAETFDLTADDILKL